MLADFTINQIPYEKRYRDHGKKFFHKDDHGNVISNRQIHNIYGFNMTRATYEGLINHYKTERPVILTRSAYPGIQRYGILWTGDNASLWEQLYQEIQMLQSLAITGVNFTGSDVGGFGVIVMASCLFVGLNLESSSLFSGIIQPLARETRNPGLLVRNTKE